MRKRARQCLFEPLLASKRVAQGPRSEGPASRTYGIHIDKTRGAYRFGWEDGIISNWGILLLLAAFFFPSIQVRDRHEHAGHAHDDLLCTGLHLEE